MRLNELAKLFVTARLKGDGNVEISGLSVDSRNTAEGHLFICIKGHDSDGHHYAEEAVRQGAAALMTERELKVELPQLIVKDSRHALAVAADHFYKRPSHSIKLIGVTGTNGKTTTTYLLEKILSDSGQSTGVIGTIERRFAGEAYLMAGTTPDALQLQRHLSEMRDAGVQYCAMEVSSHALWQGRVKGCRFRTAIFTNLSQDHLDYHETMDKYAAAKGLFFSRLGNAYSETADDRMYAVLNADDVRSEEYAAMTSAEIVTYGIDEAADVRASGIQITAQGTSFHVNTFRGKADITLQLAGKFNVYNALAAMSAALIEGIALNEIKNSLEGIPGVPGRVESVYEGQSFACLVDYAHTPDGLENVLRAIQQFAEKRIICVFGCGGDRDRKKRPLMGKIAARYGDYTIITSDNPRTESAERIMDDIEAGLLEAERGEYERIADRRVAIEKAVEMASPGDVVLIAGKGHETYQLINGVSYPFDDRVVARAAIRRLLQ